MARSWLLSEWFKTVATLDEAEIGIRAASAHPVLAAAQARLGTAGDFDAVKLEIAAIREAYVSGRRKLTPAERAVLLVVGQHKVDIWTIYSAVLNTRFPNRAAGPISKGEESVIHGDVRRCAQAGLLDRDRKGRWFLTPTGDAALQR
jgi:hypothetical protein